MDTTEIFIFKLVVLPCQESRKPKTLRMERASHGRQPRYAFVLSKRKTGNPESSEYNPASKEPKSQSAMERPSHSSHTQYENAVLKAYGIVPVSTKGRDDFVVSSKISGGSKTNSMLDDLLSTERVSDSSRVSTEQPESMTAQYKVLF